jgi:hypothetical protein
LEEINVFHKGFSLHSSKTSWPAGARFASLLFASALGLALGASGDPRVPIQIPVLQFASGFAGAFAGIGDLMLGDGDPLSIDLSASGLSLTVDMNPDN